MISIWNKYILKKFTTTFLLLLFGFYGLFILLDFSVHSSYFPKNAESRWMLITSFYFYEFINRLDVLLPFALLISLIKTLTELNVHNEIVAMLAGGVSKRKIIAPLLAAALLCTVFMYINAQYFMPISLSKLKIFSNEKKQLKKKKNDLPHIQYVSLLDQSIIVFQNYDHKERSFYDGYWIKSVDDIYRFKNLYPHEKIPVGKNVEHFLRKKDNVLYLENSEQVSYFPTMAFNKKYLFETTILPEELSLTELWQKIKWNEVRISEKSSKVLTIFFYKVIIPWLCVFVILLPAPFCLKFSRNFQIFFIYAFSIIGLVSFYTINESLEILSKRQVIHPQWMLFSTLSFLLVPGIFQYRKLR